MLTVIGESLIDEIAGNPYVGGSPLNVAVGLARLGHPVQLLSRWGADAYGGLITDYVRNHAVHAPLPPDDLATSVAYTRLAHDGSAHYDFQLSWELPELPIQQLATSTLVHTGSIATMLSPGAESVYHAVLAARSHALISFDPNYRPSIVPDVDKARQQVSRFLQLSDIVKTSEEDLQLLYPGLDPLTMAQSWLELPQGPTLVVVTSGADGIWGATTQHTTQVPALPVTVVDTIGAGDSVMSALISAVVDQELDGGQRREDLARISAGQLYAILQRAATAGAITVSRAGAKPPTAAELNARLKS